MCGSKMPYWQINLGPIISLIMYMLSIVLRISGVVKVHVVFCLSILSHSCGMWDNSVDRKLFACYLRPEL